MTGGRAIQEGGPGDDLIVAVEAHSLAKLWGALVAPVSEPQWDLAPPSCAHVCACVNYIGIPHV